MKFGFNVKGVDPAKARQGGGKQAPVGMYTAKVTGCVVAKPEGKDERLEIVYNIQDAKVNYAPLYDYISLENENVQWKLDQFLQATGMSSDSKREGQGDTDKAIGQVLKLRVRADSYQGEYRAKVGGVWKLGAGEEVGETSSGSGVTWDDISAMTEDELNADQDLLDLVQNKAEEAGIDPDEFGEWTEVVAAINENTEPSDDTEETTDDGGDDGGDDTDEDWAAILEMNEEDAELNQEAISEYAAQYEIDPDDYAEWTEVVAAIAETMENSDDGDDGGEVDYESMSMDELKEQCKERELATGGTKSALIKRLQAADELDDGPGLPD